PHFLRRHWRPRGSASPAPCSTTTFAIRQHSPRRSPPRDCREAASATGVPWHLARFDLSFGYGCVCASRGAVGGHVVVSPRRLGLTSEPRVTMKPINPRLPSIWHGGDYNPEQWPPATWDEDVRLMQECHFRVATVGVFA